MQLTAISFIVSHSEFQSLGLGIFVSHILSVLAGIKAGGNQNICATGEKKKDFFSHPKSGQNLENS